MKKQVVIELDTESSDKELKKDLGQILEGAYNRVSIKDIREEEKLNSSVEIYCEASFNSPRTFVQIKKIRYLINNPDVYQAKGIILKDLKRCIAEAVATKKQPADMVEPLVEGRAEEYDPDKHDKEFE